MWTKHALAEATEDGFKVKEIEGNLSFVAEFPEFDGERKRGVLKVGSRHCTLIYATKGERMTIITCWESNHTDIAEFERDARRRA